jgi:WD40 repeat protein
MEAHLKHLVLDTLKPLAVRIELLEQDTRAKDQELLVLRHAVEALTLKLQRPEMISIEVQTIDLDTRRSQTPKRTSSLVKPPTSTSPKKSKPPEDNSLKPVRAVGYNGRGSRHNVHFLDDMFVVYPVSSVVVVYSLEQHSQKLFSEHTAEVSALAVHKGKRMCASGQWGAKALVLVWRVDTLEVVVRHTHHVRVIIGIGFDATGLSYVTAGGDNMTSMAVWELTSVQPLATTPTDRAKILGIVVDEFAVSLRVATFGEKHARVWTFAGSSLSPKSANFGELPKNFVAACFLKSGGVLFGADNGTVYFLLDCQVVQKVKASEGPITVLRYFIDENSEQFIVSGGTDGEISLWTDELQHVSSTHFVTAALVQLLPTEPLFKIKSLDVQNTGTIVLGTSGNTLLKTDLNGETELLVSGHSADVTTVSVHPYLGGVISGGEDMTIRVYDGALCRLVSCLEMPAKVMQLEFSPCGSLVACGLGTGEVLVLDWPRLQVLTAVNLCNSDICCLKFAEDSSYLAFSDKDKVVLVSLVEDFAVKKTISARTLTLLLNSHQGLLAALTAEGELVVWDFEGRKTNVAAALASEGWSQWSIPGSWQLAGLTKSVVCSSISVNPQSTAFAAGDASVLEIYKFPHLKSESALTKGTLHSSPISSTSWLGADYLVSAGSSDCCVALWSTSP